MAHVFFAVGTLLLANGCMPAVGQSSGSSRYITEENRQVQRDAAAAVVAFCEGGFKGEIDKEDGRSSMEAGVGNDNIFYTAITESTKSEDILPKFVELVTPSWLLGRVFTLVMAPVMLVCWFCCCCASCPCCKCCRCCKKYHARSIVLQIIVGLGLLVIIVGFIGCMITSMNGFAASSDGIDNIACSSAKLLETTLVGPLPKFIGLFPVFDTFGDLVDSLDADSTFMKDIDKLIDSTASLTRSLVLATQTISMLGTSLNEASLAVQDKLHSCTFCTAIGSAVAPVSNELANGVAQALDGARVEVKKQLYGSQRQQLQNAVEGALTPMVDIKDALTNSFKVFVDQNSYNDIRGYVNGPPPSVQFSTLIIFILAFLLACCGCCVETAFVFRQKSGEREKKGKNPHIIQVPACACATWNCGFYFAILAFFIGGLLLLITVPLSGLCLILDDLSSTTLSDIATVAKISLNGDSGIILKEVVDKCFVDTAVNHNLLDIVFIRENGTRVTIRDKIVTQTKEAISTAFDEISKTLDSAAGSELKSSSMLRDLTAVLKNTSLAQTIVADADRLRNDPGYAGMINTDLSIGFVTTGSCASFQVSGQTIPGIEDFVAKLDDRGILNAASSSTCAKQVACTDPADKACIAGNNFMQLKDQLLSTNIFNCMLFEDDGGSVCDPRNANCLRSDGTVRTKNIPCTLSNYAAYIAQFSDRIDSVFTQLDNDVLNGLDKINKEMRRIVNKYIVDPVEEVTSGLTCSFFGRFYREVIESFCYQGLYGFRMIGWSYASSGILAIFFIMLMFAAWRRLIDNVNLWDPQEGKVVIDISEGEATPQSSTDILK